MALLRKLNKAAWWSQSEEVALSELNSDAYKNVATTRGTLSLFNVPDGDEEFLVEILAAIASKGDNLKPAEYCLVSETVIVEAGFSLLKSKGNTDVPKVDDAHLDVVGLTISSLPRFIEVCIDNGRLDKIQKKDVLNGLRALLRRGDLKQLELKEGISKYLALE